MRRTMETIRLASASPRRKELLQRLGYVLEVCPSDIDETPFPGESAVDFAERMAAEKAGAHKGPAQGTGRFRGMVPGRGAGASPSGAIRFLGCENWFRLCDLVLFGADCLVVRTGSG